MFVLLLVNCFFKQRISRFKREPLSLFIFQLLFSDEIQLGLGTDYVCFSLLFIVLIIVQEVVSSVR
jgi:hypothetical protein